MIDMDKVKLLIELRGVYDGWSIAVMEDGTMANRWANETGDGPQPGYERRYEAAEKAIESYAQGDEDASP